MGKFSAANRKRESKEHSIAADGPSYQIQWTTWIPDRTSVELIIAKVAQTWKRTNKKLTDHVDADQLQIKLIHASTLYQARVPLDSKEAVRKKADDFLKLKENALSVKRR